MSARDQAPLPSHRWVDLTSADFAAHDMASVIAVLPIAAVEQHGPHLPVGVDAMIADGYVERVIARLSADARVLFLPTQAIGKSNEHLSFPGTLTLSAETVIRAWVEIGESVWRAGCRKLIIVNSHGGNIAPMDIVARELRVRLGLLAVTCAWHRFGYPDGLFGADELRLGIHAGEMETALMLALRPDTVKMALAENFRPRSADMERDFVWLRATQPVGFGWMSEDLHPSGAMGDAASATAAKGAAALDHGVDMFITLLSEVAAFAWRP